MGSIGLVSPTPFEVQSEELEGGIRVFTVSGELDMNTAPELKQEFDGIAAGDHAVMLDLSECEFIDSTGIALIVRAWQQFDQNGGEKGEGRFVICCSNHQVKRLLKITGVDSSIPMHEQRDAALAALRS